MLLGARKTPPTAAPFELPRQADGDAEDRASRRCTSVATGPPDDHARPRSSVPLRHLQGRAACRGVEHARRHARRPLAAQAAGVGLPRAAQRLLTLVIKRGGRSRAKQVVLGQGLQFGGNAVLAAGQTGARRFSVMSLRRKRARGSSCGLGLAAVAALVSAPAAAHAQVDPAGCTATLGYDANVPTWDTYFSNPANANRTPCCRSAPARRRRAAARRPTARAPRPTGRDLTTVIYQYWDALVALTASDARSNAARSRTADQEADRDTRSTGAGTTTPSSRTPENIANLDAGAQRRRSSGAASARAPSPPTTGLDAACARARRSRG